VKAKKRKKPNGCTRKQARSGFWGQGEERGEKSALKGWGKPPAGGDRKRGNILIKIQGGKDLKGL